MSSQNVETRSKPVKEKIVVGSSPMGGRGMFAAVNIKTGEVVHTAPVLLLERQTTEFLENTPKSKIYGYIYQWPFKGGSAAFALGYGSLFNHSDDPDVDYEMWTIEDGDPAAPCIKYIARRPIPAGQEICINYASSSGPEAESELWFKPKPRNTERRK